MKTAFIILAAIVSAAPAVMASTTTCGNTTLDQYLTPNFTCISGNLMFSDFAYSPSGNPSGIEIPATSIHVTPLTNTLDEGFQFAGGWNVGTQPDGTTAIQDSVISFTVSTVDGKASLEDLSLYFNGSFSGTGLSSVTEQYCANGALATCGAGNSGQLKVANPPGSYMDATSFAGVTSISVSKDISVASGIGGTANISQVINTFSQIPEPSSYLLLGTGLLGCGLVRRRSSRS